MLQVESKQQHKCLLTKSTAWKDLVQISFQQAFQSSSKALILTKAINLEMFIFASSNCFSHLAIDSKHLREIMENFLFMLHFTIQHIKPTTYFIIYIGCSKIHKEVNYWVQRDSSLKGVNNTDTNNNSNNYHFNANSAQDLESQSHR